MGFVSDHAAWFSPAFEQSGIFTGCPIGATGFGTADQKCEPALARILDRYNFRAALAQGFCRCRNRTSAGYRCLLAVPRRSSPRKAGHVRSRLSRIRAPGGNRSPCRTGFARTCSRGRSYFTDGDRFSVSSMNVPHGSVRKATLIFESGSCCEGESSFIPRPSSLLANSSRFFTSNPM